MQILRIKKGKLMKYAVVQCGLTSALLHLDWSGNGNFLMVNSQAYELKFVDVEGKKQVYASSMRGTEWSSWTCKIGWAVQGIMTSVDGTDVNTVDRARCGKVLATGDDFQQVKLFKYPSVVEQSGYKGYIAHSSHVTRVRFTLHDNFLVSTGGNDKTNIIWCTNFGDLKRTTRQVSKLISQSSLKEEDYEEDDDDDDEFVQVKARSNKYHEEEVEETVVESQPKEQGGFLLQQEV